MNAKKPKDDKPEPKRTRAEDAEPPTEEQFKEFVTRMFNGRKPVDDRKEKGDRATQ